MFTGSGFNSIVLICMVIVQAPEKLETWIIPGTGGVIGVIVTMHFNGPRKNAREDLAILLDANVIYIGFLRKVAEIDATFKHAYIENQKFSKEDMEATVQQIDQAVEKTTKTIDTYFK